MPFGKRVHGEKHDDGPCPKFAGVALTEHHREPGWIIHGAEQQIGADAVGPQFQQLGQTHALAHFGRSAIAILRFAASVSALLLAEVWRPKASRSSRDFFMASILLRHRQRGPPLVGICRISSSGW